MTDAELFAKLVPYTKSSPERLAAMADALRRVDREKIAGDIVECGVWRGGNIILARKLSPDRVCWLYDTFTGMTEPTDLDTKKSGYMAYVSYRKKELRGERWAAVSALEVRQCLRETGTLDDGKLRFVAGDVVQTLRSVLNIPDKIAVLRLDTDWHASTKVELEVLYPRLESGGVLIVDDYGHWMGSRKAVDDYFGKVCPPMTVIDYTAVSMIKSVP